MRTSGTIGVIDYGMGNLRSVSKAIEHLGGSVYVGDEPKKLSRSKKLILPGVGAFGDAMAELKKRNLIRLIQDAASGGTPLFGICLGLQLFFEHSSESPGVRGLGIWKGSVLRFKAARNRRLKIPHMGWNQVSVRKSSALLKRVKNLSHFYFVHSYYANPEDKASILGETSYGVKFPSVIAAGTVWAVQFHPEKSQSSGLQVLKNFIWL